MIAFQHLALNCRNPVATEEFYTRHFGTGGEQRVGFKHLAFEVPKLEPVIAALQENGVTTEPILDCSKAVPGLRICFFKDPDGNILELMEGWKDE